MGKKKTYKDRFIDLPQGEMETLAVYTPPQAIGMYIINENLHFPFYKKPKRIHRLFTRILLGWKWSNKVI